MIIESLFDAIYMLQMDNERPTRAYLSTALRPELEAELYPHSKHREEMGMPQLKPDWDEFCTLCGLYLEWVLPEEASWITCESGRRHVIEKGHT